MGQEWDYPPDRQWKPEIIVLPKPQASRQRYDRLIEHRNRKPKTLWAWYRSQMQGGGSKLYKLNLTALVLTACGFVIGVVAIATIVVCLLVSNASHAKDSTISLERTEILGNLLNDQAKSLAYNVKYQVQNCEQGNKYVCDVVVSSGPYSAKFLAVADSRMSNIDHFTIPMEGRHTPLLMSSYVVVTSLVGGSPATLKMMSDFLQSEVEQAQAGDGTIEDEFMGTFQRVVVAPKTAVLVTVSYE